MDGVADTEALVFEPVAQEFFLWLVIRNCIRRLRRSPVERHYQPVFVNLGFWRRPRSWLRLLLLCLPFLVPISARLLVPKLHPHR